MREPKVHMQAGKPPGSFIANLLDDISIRIALPYAPTSGDPRKFMLDLSQYEDVEIAAVKAFTNPNVEALIIRIGGSASVRDTKFKLFWDLAREFKIPRSIYTYNWPGWSIDLHIQNFMESVELWTPGDLGEGPIWVDVECHADKSRIEVSNHAIDYIMAIEQATGKTVGWYSADWFLDGYMQQQEWMKAVFAWWAQWLFDQPMEHPGPVYHNPYIPDDKVVAHQTGSNGDGRLFGGSGRVDTDRWEASVDLFNELFNIEEAPPPSGDLKEKVERNTMDIEELTERLNVIDEYLRSYDEA